MTAPNLDNLDMVNRDPHDLNAHLKVSFDDVIGEPEDAHSIDCVWINAYKCYHKGSNCCYKFLTVLCAIPLSFCWGCHFAMVTFTHIWSFGPILKDFEIQCGVFTRLHRACINCCLVPICEAFALCFSRVKVEQGS